MADIGEVLHGTTVATNAILEQKGARVGLVTTKGFEQVLQIARSFVPGGLAGWIIWPKPEPLASLEHTVGAVERVASDGTVVTRLDGLHGIVHAAAHWVDFRPMQEVPPQDWTGILAANLTAPWALTRVALPHLQAADDGCVIFCDCPPEDGKVRAYYGAFGVAKAGLRALAADWAAEKPGVRLHCFDPGPMRTAMRLLGYPGTPPETLPEPEGPAETLSALLAPACGADAAISGQLFWSADRPPAARH